MGGNQPSSLVRIDLTFLFAYPGLPKTFLTYGNNLYIRTGLRQWQTTASWRAVLWTDRDMDMAGRLIWVDLMPKSKSKIPHAPTSWQPEHIFFRLGVSTGTVKRIPELGPGLACPACPASCAWRRLTVLQPACRYYGYHGALSYSSWRKIRGTRKKLIRRRKFEGIFFLGDCPVPAYWLRPLPKITSTAR